MRALVYMCLVSADKDAEPWFGLGLESLSELAFGRVVPDKDKDPQGRAASLRAVGRAMTELQQAGAIRTSERARFGSHRSQNARYRLYLDGPCPSGEKASPRKWHQPLGSTLVTPPDGDRPMAPDAECLAPSDAERPAAGETIGRFVSDHRTKNVCPQDEKRPTKEEEEEEERINKELDFNRTVEGTPAGARLKVVEDRSVGRRSQGTPRTPGERPIIPFAVPSLTNEDPSSSVSPQAKATWCGTCESSDWVDSPGGLKRCPACNPPASSEAS